MCPALPYVLYDVQNGAHGQPVNPKGPDVDQAPPGSCARASPDTQTVYWVLTGRRSSALQHIIPRVSQPTQGVYSGRNAVLFLCEEHVSATRECSVDMLLPLGCWKRPEDLAPQAR